MDHVIASLNYKGGVGKTTILYQLATSIAYNYKRRKINKRILLIDNDPQANLTQFFMDPDYIDEDRAITHLYGRKTPNNIKSIIHNCQLPNDITIDLVPNTFDTVFIEGELIMSQTANSRLTYFINQLKNDYDLVFIDNSPYLNVFTRNALAIATRVIIPTVPALSSFRGITRMAEVLSDIQKIVNPRLEIIGVVLNRIDERLKDHTSNRREAYLTLKDMVFATEIHQASAVQRVENRKKPIYTLAKAERSYLEFKELAREVLYYLDDEEIEFDRDKLIRNKLDSFRQKLAK